MEYYGDQPLMVYGDSKLLFQGFSNLLSNAIKYSPADAKVVVRAGQTERQIVVTVEDFGIGIPARDREHIFSRYYRGSNVSGFVGTGIGLFLVAMVVRLHNGQITVDTAEGKGSQFNVTLTNQGGSLEHDSLRLTGIQPPRSSLHIPLAKIARAGSR